MKNNLSSMYNKKNNFNMFNTLEKTHRIEKDNKLLFNKILNIQTRTNVLILR